MSRKRRRKPRPYIQLQMTFGPRAATAINHDLAAATAEAYGYVEKGRCYKNAVMSMSYLGYRTDHETAIEYVEGWLLLRPEYAVEHGWLEVEGEVVDVTLPGLYQATDYYGVYRYSFDQALTALSQRHITLPLFGNHEVGERAMREAWAQLPLAHDTARAIACIGYMKTGKWSVAIPDGIFEESHERR